MSASTELISAAGIDYTQLRDFLKSECWQQADAETAKLTYDIIEKLLGQSEAMESPDMLEIANLPFSQAAKFPCLDLQTLDNLWMNYSSRYFGFSMQKSIWEEVQGNYLKFSDRVGWRDQDNWLNYPELTFSLAAPKGHLPALCNSNWTMNSGTWVGGWGLLIHCFIQRLADCSTSDL